MGSGYGCGMDARQAADPDPAALPPRGDVAEVFEPAPESRDAPEHVWIDLHSPDEAQVKDAHLKCGTRIPTREDLSEIESSSRHYVENGALYLSLPLVINALTDDPTLTPVGFIVTRERLVTVRFDKLKSFENAAEQFKANPPMTGLQAFTGLIEALIDRKADLLEKHAEEIDTLSHEVFRRKRQQRLDGDAMRALLARVGVMADRGSKMRTSLVTLARVLPFVVDVADGKLPDDIAPRLHSAKEDVVSLIGFQEGLANKVQFLLDAALGFINIDQNDVFKILTVVSAVGVPPTLVASIYGMNFKHMPELDWTFGYPYAWTLIVLSTIIPLWWFRKKGWF